MWCSAPPSSCGGSAAADVFDSVASCLNSVGGTNGGMVGEVTRSNALGCSVRELMNDKWVSDVCTHGFGTSTGGGKALFILRTVGRGPLVFIWGVLCPVSWAYNINFAQDPSGHMPDFHCNAKYFLITYSQSAGLDEWAVNDHFSSLGAECIIARENHATRGTHLHAFIAFERKFRSRRPDIFDVGGFHPNIVPSRGNPGGGYDYATKDGEVVAGGLVRPGGGGVSKASTPWHWIIAASSGGELRDLVRELAPKEAILRAREIEFYIGMEFAEERPAYVHPIGFEFELGMVPELAEWRRVTFSADQVEGESWPSTLCAHGPSPPGASSPGGGPRATLESRGR